MSDPIIWLAFFVIGVAVGVLVPPSHWFKKHIADEAPEEVWMPKDEPAPVEAQKVEDISFSVTGKPRAVPWHIRRRELEEAARTKRRRYESFREAE
jgi:hypothetical protein